MFKDDLFRSEFWGAIFIIVLGSLFHFCFEWTGGWKPSALICAVNESTWEHMKLAFWPAFMYALIQYFTLQKRPENFLWAKTLSFYVMVITIPLLFYGYTGILGDHYLPIDILIFIIAVFLGQWVSYQIMKEEIQPSSVWIPRVMLVLIIAAFSLLTYFPPHWFLFKDPVSGGYGILSVT